MPYFRCPKCAIRTHVDSGLMGQTAECRFCRTRFPAISEYDPDELTVDESPWQHKAKEQSKASQEHDNEVPTTTMRHPAYSRIRRPAIALSCISAIGLVLCMTGGLALAFKGCDIYANARAMRTGLLFSPLFNTDKVNGVHVIVYGSVLAFLGTLLHLFILLGSLKVKRLRGVGWGYTAAGLGIGSLFLAVLGVAIVPIPTPWIGRVGLNGLITAGISMWLIFTINSDVVREAIQENRLKGF